MRVTQSMLSNNTLRNLSNSYSKLGKLQEQINTGKKITLPSDDPALAMKGIGYRTELNNVEQFSRNISEAYNWLDATEDALGQVGEVLQRAKELVIQANNGSVNLDDRGRINSELQELREHAQNLANTQVGNRYIFSGTKTTTAPFDVPVGEYVTGDDSFKRPIEIEVFDGSFLQVNSTPIEIFNQIDQMFEAINKDMLDGSELSAHITTIDSNMDKLLTSRADIGARRNRLELVDSRQQSQEIVVTKRMSENEDIDIEKAIVELTTQESIHRAALSAGSRIIQPTLVDFLR